MTPDEAIDIGAAALTFLADDSERLARFAGLTGVDAPAIRAYFTDPTFLAGVLDYVLEDEALLMSFVDSAGLAPEVPSLARDVLASGEP